jgi:thioredoxin-like negative regulator of GroEL
VSAIAEKHKGNLTVAKINIVKHHIKAEEYQVQGVPATVFFKDGKVVKQFSGFKYEEELEKEIEQVLKSEK